MGNARRSAIVACGKYMFVFDYDSPHPPSQTGASHADQLGYLHEILIPRRSRGRGYFAIRRGTCKRIVFHKSPTFILKLSRPLG